MYIRKFDFYLTFIDEKTKENAFDEKLFSVIGLNNGKISDFFNGNNISEYNFSHWKYEKCEKINLEKANIADIYITEKYFNYSLCITKYYDKENNKIIGYEDQNFPYPKLENNLEQRLAHVLNHSLENRCVGQLELLSFFENQRPVDGFNLQLGFVLRHITRQQLNVGEPDQLGFGHINAVRLANELNQRDFTERIERCIILNMLICKYFAIGLFFNKCTDTLVFFKIGLRLLRDNFGLGIYEL